MKLIDITIEKLHSICEECPNNGTSQCDKLNCNVGYSLTKIEDMKESEIMFLEEDTSLIPNQDAKYYEKRKIASSVASICKLCKECNEYHNESCAISLARKSIEVTVLRDMEAYPGNFLSYIINVGKQDPNFSSLVMEEYQKLS